MCSRHFLPTIPREMARFELNILGCGAATPTLRHLPTTQVVNVRDKLFMIDCGEGAQIGFRRAHLKLNRLGHIFISHLHGDHCFGLPGLLSTMALTGHTGELVIHAHPDAEQLFRPLFDYFCRENPFDIRFNAISPSSSEVIYSDRSVTISTIPLKHRIPTCGFLFEEAQSDRHLRGDMVEFYNIPTYMRAAIKQGDDFITPDGQTIPNAHLTLPATPPARYAYCSDTMYNERIIPLIEGADLLYHEATFADDNEAWASRTFHSTARQAARLATKAGVKSLLLGHFSARYDKNEEILLQQAREEYANVQLARENMQIVIKK